MLLKLGGLFFIASLIFWLWALFDAITSNEKQIRNLPKWAWIIVVLLFFEVGALAWVLFGRPKGEQNVRDTPLPRDAPSARPRARSSRPVGPDDDPEFLAGI